MVAWVSRRQRAQQEGPKHRRRQERVRLRLEREFFIVNLLVRIHFTIVMIRWTGLAPWEQEGPQHRRRQKCVRLIHTSYMSFIYICIYTLYIYIKIHMTRYIRYIYTYIYMARAIYMRASRKGHSTAGARNMCACRKVDVKLPGKGNSNSHGARPVHLIITMIKWIRTSRLSSNNSLSVRLRLEP